MFETLDINTNIKKFELITDAVKRYVKEELLRIFEGKHNGLSIDSFPLDKMLEILQEMDVQVVDDYDSNGWQNDYWQHFKYQNKVYCISGSGHYGNLSISECTDEDLEEFLENEEESKDTEQCYVYTELDSTLRYLLSNSITGWTKEDQTVFDSIDTTTLNESQTFMYTQTDINRRLQQ